MCESGGGGGGGQREPTQEERDLWAAQTDYANRDAGLQERRFEMEQERMGWARENMDWLKDTREESREWSRENMDWLRESRGWAREKWDMYKNRAIPMLEKYTKEVEDWASPTRIAAEEGRAAADVKAAYGQEKRGLMRSLGRYGMNPGSGKFAGAMRSLAIGQAGATAGAKTSTRFGILARDLANKGGLASAWLGATGGGQVGGLSGQIGGQAGMAGPIGGGVGASYGSAISGLGNVSNAMAQNRQAGNAAAAQQSGGMWQGIGALAGSLGSAWIMASDVRLKTNVKQIDELPCNLKLYEFNYFDDDKTVYTGVLAHEVRAVKPHLVHESDGGYLAVDYGNLIEELVNEACEQRRLN